MYTSELMRYAKTMRIKNFIGVFPLNKLPKHLPTATSKPFCFIVNTDTHNLPGQHWIAVSYEKGGIVRAFDPLGALYPPLLSQYLARHVGICGGRVIFNSVMYQNPTKKTCGQHCLRWLKWRSRL